MAPRAVALRASLAIAPVIVALAAGGCGGGSDETSTSGAGGAAGSTGAGGATADASSGATGPSGTSAGPGGQSEPAAAKPAIYFTAGEQFRKVDASLPAAGDQVEEAAKELVDGPPPGSGAETQIPDDVELEGLTVSDGTATVDVSRGFLHGIPSDPDDRDDLQEQELAARLGQFTYTLTQFDGVDAVKVVSGGTAVEQQAERQDFAKPSRGPQRKVRPKGPKSTSTRKLQQRLADLQYLPRSAIDGVEGYRTQQAVIAFQAWEGLGRDGVVGPLTTAALAKAKPPKPRAGGPDRRIEVYREKGVALLIAHGKTKRAIHVSAGAAGTPTPAGSFEVFRKELRSWSVPFQVWLPFASYFNNGIAFHEYPEVPPYPASHGCVRVPSPEAQIVYRYAKLGTAVVVI